MGLKLAETLPAGEIVLDCAGVQFVGSEELGALVALNRKVRGAGGRLRLVNVETSRSQQIGARFAGDAYYLPSSDSGKEAIVFAFQFGSLILPTVVLHTEASAHRKLDAFRKSAEPWIVAVNMVSEGVDIPRLRVGVYATAARTESRKCSPSVSNITRLFALR